MDIFFLLSVTLLLIFVYKFLHVYKQYVKNSHHGPPEYPIIGCLISFYKNRYRLLDWYTDLLAISPKNTIVIRRLGAPRTIVTANPDNIEYILKTNFNNFPKGEPFTKILGDFLGHGIFNVDGELWRAQRKLASHEFTTKSMKELVMNTLKDEVHCSLLPALEAKAGTGQVVDMQEVLRGFTFNMICKVSLGMDPSQVVFPLAKAFDMASEVSARRAAAPIHVVWKVKRWFKIGSERKLKDAIGDVHSYVEHIICDKRKKIDKEVDNHQLDLLCRLMSAGHEPEMVRDMVISFIMAGRDTTSAAMTWLFWLLSCHPNIEDDLIKEIETFNESTQDYDSLKQLNFHKACLCESMRLYPPVAWDSKHAISDDILPDGTPVRAGDRVTYFPYGMGRMENVWGKDRLEFKPDRWFDIGSDEEMTMKDVSPFSFPVFQAGPRVCLGKEMAFIQMKYVVASILSRFKYRPVCSDRPAFVPLLTAYMAGGFKVLIEKRETW